MGAGSNDWSTRHYARGASNDLSQRRKLSTGPQGLVARTALSLYQDSISGTICLVVTVCLDGGVWCPQKH